MPEVDFSYKNQQLMDSGGERGIRTPDRRLTYTRFPGVRLKPLIHLSGRPRV